MLPSNETFSGLLIRLRVSTLSNRTLIDFRFECQMNMHLSIIENFHLGFIMHSQWSLSVVYEKQMIPSSWKNKVSTICLNHEQLVSHENLIYKWQIQKKKYRLCYILLHFIYLVFVLLQGSSHVFTLARLTANLTFFHLTEQSIRDCW